MNGALLLALITLGCASQEIPITYQNVPESIARASLFEWSDSGAPSMIATRAPGGGAVVLSSRAGRLVVARFDRADGGYLLDGPFVSPAAPAARTIESGWSHTAQGALPDEASGITVVDWIRPDAAASPWPRCFARPAAWECWGVQTDSRGAVVIRGSNRIWWTLVSPQPSGPVRTAAWGRLLVVHDAAQTAAGLRALLARPVPPPAQRLAGLRLDTAAVEGAVVVPLAPDAVWVAGERIPPKAWLEIRTASGGPSFVALEDLAATPSAEAWHVTLPEPRTVSGIVSGRDGRRAAGALVSLFRAIDLPQPGSAVKPRRVFAAETIADENGNFRIEGVGDADYEIVAWHSQLGRGGAELSRADTDVTIELAASGLVKGRVIIGGRPAAGVAVVSVPDAAAFNGARDMTDAKGGDATTGEDGRFSVIAAPSGGGELRVGGGGHAVKRIGLPRPPAPVLDLGDIDLGAPIRIVIVLEADPRCVIQAVGPIGRTGLDVRQAAPRQEGGYELELPEAGTWQFGLQCGSQRRPLSPAMMQITAAHHGKEVRFQLRR